MSSDLSVSPIVMINRIAAREVASDDVHLAKVAELRMRLATAESAQQARAALFDPSPALPPALTGADVDRLV
ncbi:hypothetical protein [Devosia sp.]|uniref:hypothetical protein n=1 Tax=Devosia sp. TaxID=1871048 RepID=UPI002736C3CC|nr:hypothetical protein [Devosia sp.]MDP2779195.1 hypothetical protein [Devosia sp.]